MNISISHWGTIKIIHWKGSLNPNCDIAKVGLERLDKIMKGVDPDAEEELEEDEYIEEGEEDEPEWCHRIL